MIGEIRYIMQKLIQIKLNCFREFMNVKLIAVSLV